MLELLRTLAVHQGRFHQSFLDSWGPQPAAETLDLVLDALVYDGMWLTKFPLLWTPAFGLERLDALHKAFLSPVSRPKAAEAVAEIAALRPRVDADTLRFILKLTPGELQTRVEIFFGAGR